MCYTDILKYYPKLTDELSRNSKVIPVQYSKLTYVLY